MNDVLLDLALLSKPNVKLMQRKNDILPFEDANSLEFLGTKNKCSVFGLVSNTKKRPNNLIMVRNYYYFTNSMNVIISSKQSIYKYMNIGEII